MGASHSHAGNHSSGSHHGPGHYVKIWAILLVLLILSILGPEIGIKWVTIVSAFGIAFVKAYIVVQEFMHLKNERRVVHYALATSLIAMGMFVAGIYADVGRTAGENWKNEATQSLIDKHAAEGHNSSAPH
jgi:caa(3)-type oxidase subunit IV